MVQMDSLSTTFAALADPTRRAILARLASGEATVSQLAEPFAMSMPAVTKHLKVLQRAGLITQTRQAQWRPCKLQAKPLQDVSAWVEPYRRFWEERLDRLDDYLRQLQAQGMTMATTAPPPPSSAVTAEAATTAPDGLRTEQPQWIPSEQATSPLGTAEQVSSTQSEPRPETRPESHPKET